MIGSSVDENNFSHKLLLTGTEVSKIGTNIKFSKTQLPKMIQSGRNLQVILLSASYLPVILQVMFLARKEALKQSISLAPELAPAVAGKATEYYINKGINELNKKVYIT